MYRDDFWSSLVNILECLLLAHTLHYRMSTYGALPYKNWVGSPILAVY